MNQELASPLEESPEALLKDFFDKYGYVRVFNPQRKEELGDHYHKGHEVRLVARDENEAAELRRLILLVGLKPGNAYKKHSRVVQPIYGKAAVDWFAPAIIHHTSRRHTRKRL
jgi:hypothetical protein